MCATPGLEIFTNDILTCSDFPELKDYQYFLDRRSQQWDLLLVSKDGCCLCSDSDLLLTISKLATRLMDYGYSLCYLPNDLSEADSPIYKYSIQEALKIYPPSLNTPPVRVLLEPVEEAY